MYIVAKNVEVVFSLADESVSMGISEMRNVGDKLSKKMTIAATPKNVLNGPLGNRGVSVIRHVTADQGNASGMIFSKLF